MKRRLAAGLVVLGVVVLVIALASRSGGSAAAPAMVSTSGVGFTTQELAAEADGICTRYNRSIDGSALQVRTLQQRFSFERTAARSKLRQLRSLIPAREAAGSWSHLLEAAEAEAEAMERYSAARLDGGVQQPQWQAAGRFYIAQAKTGRVADHLNIPDCAVTIGQQDQGALFESQRSAVLIRVCYRAAAAFDQLPAAADPGQLAGFLSKGQPVFDQFVRDTSSQLPPLGPGEGSLARYVELHQYYWSYLGTKSTAIQYDRPDEAESADGLLYEIGRKISDETHRLGIPADCGVFSQRAPANGETL